MNMMEIDFRYLTTFTPQLSKKYERINTDDKLSAMVNHIEKLGLINQIKPDVILHLEKKQTRKARQHGPILI